MQLSLFLVNIWQLPVALAKNFGTLVVGRALGGLSSAGGSVTLGMVADMWEADAQQYAVAYVVFSSVGGSVLGPIVGGFVEAYSAGAGASGSSSSSEAPCNSSTSSSSPRRGRRA